MNILKIFIILLLIICAISMPIVSAEGEIDTSKIAFKSSLSSDITLSNGDVYIINKESDLSVSSYTNINDIKFTPTDTIIGTGKNITWTTGETGVSNEKIPIVTFEYKYTPNNLKETIILKENKNLTFVITPTKGSKLISWDHEEYKIVNATNGNTMDGIILQKPYGTDAKGIYIPMNYNIISQDKTTTTLLLDYNRSISITYPLTIDPTWTSVSGCWTATIGDEYLVMWNATGTSTWTPPTNISTTKYLIVAGGGGSAGVGSAGTAGGGGGAGGLLCNLSSDYTISNNIKTIVVGRGGNGADELIFKTLMGYNGGNSYFGDVILNQTAIGGGGGGNNTDGRAGGSGGGGYGTSHGGDADYITPRQGYDGGDGDGLFAGGGGGGAGHTGYVGSSTTGGNGGEGVVNNITGEDIYYSGGGGGGGQSTAGSHGLGSGVNSGGGGTTPTSGSGGGNAGSSGIVIIKYKLLSIPISSFTQNKTNGETPLPVLFTDTSTQSPTSWSWGAKNLTPGNNTWFQFSTTQNPTLTLGVGNWSINVTAINSMGSNISTQTSWVNVSPLTSPISSFTPSGLTQGNYTKTVSFTDTSTGGITSSRSWGFKNITPGNNTWIQFSTSQNPSYTFHVGNYTINLTSTNAAGSSISSQSTWINISESTLCADGGTFSTFSAFGSGYRSVNEICTIEMWNATGTTNWNATGNVTADSIVSYVVVGGGGGGGKLLGGGGGGAGGYRESTITGLTGTQTVTVGTGGAASTTTNIPGIAGGNSVFSSITSPGGSGGGSRNNTPDTNVVPGASVGGGGSPSAATTMASNTSTGYGNVGGTGLYSTSSNYQGGGGGGFISAGTNAASNKGGNGGAATVTTITGSNLVLAGGGGGGVYSSTAGNRGAGGVNGTTTVGGLGAYRTNAAVAAVASTGSGGGGGGSTTTGVGSAGSGGVVIIRYNNLTLPTVAPSASFTANITNGTEPLAILFTDTSTNTPTSWSWGAKNLTPGNNTWFQFSTTQNPTLTLGAGNWSVNLTATNGIGSGVSGSTWINVSAGSGVILPIVQWTITDQTIRFPGTVTVNDTSLNTPTSWQYYWDDGTSNTTTNNATHKYTKRGVFHVTLNSTNSAGSNISTYKIVRVYGNEIYT